MYMNLSNLLRVPTYARGFMNLILLHIKYRHVSATHVAVFRVVRTRIPIQLYEYVDGYYVIKSHS